MEHRLYFLVMVIERTSLNGRSVNRNPRLLGIPFTWRFLLLGPFGSDSDSFVPCGYPPYVPGDGPVSKSSAFKTPNSLTDSLRYLISAGVAPAPSI